MAVSKRLKFEILRRDGHKCRYCGAKAANAELTVDHVIPVALGGTDEPSNLVAACRDCNSGKTSSSPDAPLVADVNEDALRWSRALAAAADQMRAELAGREDIYCQFEQWWGQWTHGFKKEPVPRPDGWRSSVDSFLAAGLPLEVLRWCVDKAMASKATPDQTWRYMCGIAWRKVTELQEAAKGIAGSSDLPTDEDRGPRTPDEFAEHLLASLDEKERARAYRDEDSVRDDPEGPAGDDEGRSSGALWFALRDLLCDRRVMANLLAEILGTWPDGRGATALAAARQDLERRFGPDFDENSALINAAWEVTQELQAQRAEEYLATLPDGEREAWVERARIIWTSERDLGFNDSFYITEAADLAREAAEVSA